MPVLVYENALRIAHPDTVISRSKGTPPDPLVDARRKVDELHLLAVQGDSEAAAARDGLIRRLSYMDEDRLCAPPKRKRGKVVDFSRASRKRLMRLLSELRWSEMGAAHFVTLTYHSVPDNWLANFRAWLQALRRAGYRYLWRLELQKRGAPHWHLILWSTDLEAAPLSAVRRMWHEIAAHGSKAHLTYGWHQRSLDSFRAARAYLSKYIAKLAPGSHLEGRRSWGASRDLPRSPQITSHLSARKFFELRRICRKLIRARSRAKGRKWQPRAIPYLYVSIDFAAALDLLVWLGIDHVLDDCKRAAP